MRKILVPTLVGEIAQMCIRANYYAEKKLLKALKQAEAQETSSLGKNILGQIIANDEIAADTHVPMCQDTGIVVVFVEIGQEVELVGDLEQAINDGIRQGYDQGYLRKSVVRHPLDRVNTKDNAPAVIHYKWVPGDKLKITLAPKGAGSENMSALKMLKPSDGYDGVKKFVVETIKNAGGNACPPLIVGVGIGGTMDKCAMIAKESILRPLDDAASHPVDRQLEEELLVELNETNVGPMGFGGVTTALAVKVNSYPCHIASLPVAVNIQCHAARHESQVF